MPPLTWEGKACLQSIGSMLAFGACVKTTSELLKDPPIQGRYEGLVSQHFQEARESGEALVGVDPQKHTLDNYLEFLHETLFLRVVDSFQTFVIRIIKKMFQTDPSMVPWKTKKGGKDEVITLETFFTVPFVDIMKGLVKDHLRTLRHASIDSLAGEVRDSCGFELFPDPHAYERIRVSIALRNLFVHHHGYADEQFCEIVERFEWSKQYAKLGDRITVDENEVVGVAKLLGDAALSIDNRAAAKWRFQN